MTTLQPAASAANHNLFDLPSEVPACAWEEGLKAVWTPPHTDGEPRGFVEIVDERGCVVIDEQADTIEEARAWLTDDVNWEELAEAEKRDRMGDE